MRPCGLSRCCNYSPCHHGLQSSWQRNPETDPRDGGLLVAGNDLWSPSIYQAVISCYLLLAPAGTGGLIRAGSCWNTPGSGPEEEEEEDARGLEM